MRQKLSRDKTVSKVLHSVKNFTLCVKLYTQLKAVFFAFQLENSRLASCDGCDKYQVWGVEWWKNVGLTKRKGGIC